MLARSLSPSCDTETQATGLRHSAASDGVRETSERAREDANRIFMVAPGASYDRRSPLVLRFRRFSGAYRVADEGLEVALDLAGDAVLLGVE